MGMRNADNWSTDPTPSSGEDREPLSRFHATLRTPRGMLAGCLGCTLAIAVLNRVGSLFQVPAGIALVDLAPAVSTLAGVLFGWWGVVASFIGYQLLPWGLATTPARVAFFAAAASLEAAVPAAARLRPKGSTGARTMRVVLFAAVLNTLTSALAGVPAVVRLSTPPMTSHEIASAFAGWFLGDMMTMAVILFPLVVLMAPGLVMRDADLALLCEAARRRRAVTATGVVTLFIVAMMQILQQGWGVNPHWVATFLVAPVLAGAAMGGIGGALVCNGVVGVLYVVQVLHLADTAPRDDLFGAVFATYWNLGLFTTMAVTAGLYAGRARVLLQDVRRQQLLLQDSFDDVVTALAAAIEAKDRGTENHLQRVAQMAVALGRRLGIEGERLELLRYAAILHDVGKMGIREDVLNKPSALTPEEMEEVKRHVTIGVDILKGVKLLRPAIPFIRYHQERWDGQTEARYPGYFGLKGEEIPPEARIIAVVDAYDAMTSDRPYRPALNHDEALDELRREAGMQFDPTVVHALTEILDEIGQPPL